MAETCPACGAPASGRFCDQCGVALDAACRDCGSPLPRGARFCNECGASVGAGPARSPLTRGSRVPWIVAGVSLAALLLFLVIPRARGPREAVAEGPQPPFAQPAPPGAGAAGGAPAGNPGAVDLSQMTPRQAADRLFNRVMTAVSNGDSAQARQFLPMALQAYGMAGPLDDDARYHVAALHLVGGDWASARAQADSLLASNPTHLFGLYTAAQAEAGRGDREQAAALYRRFLESYDREVARQLPEYAEHAQGLPAMREQARRTAAPPAG